MLIRYAQRKKRINIVALSRSDKNFLCLLPNHQDDSERNKKKIDRNVLEKRKIRSSRTDEERKRKWEKTVVLAQIIIGWFSLSRNIVIAIVQMPDKWKTAMKWSLKTCSHIDYTVHTFVVWFRLVGGMPVDLAE